MTVNEADPEVDRVYEYLERQFGQKDPRSSGYRSIRSFEYEAGVTREVLRRHVGWILDVGCGHGLITAPLVTEDRCVFGVDYNESATYSASRGGLLAIQGDAFRMPFREASFDIVLGAELIHNYDPEHAERLIAEMARVTRPGGVLIWKWRDDASLLRRLIRIAFRILDTAQGRPATPLFGHHIDTVCGWAGSHRLEIVETLSLSPLLGLTIQNVKSLSARLLGTSYLAVTRRSQ